MTWVLIVDDDLYTRRLLERVLRDDGLDVHSANGREALGFLDGEQPGAIVLDVALPGMDGKAFLREARDSGVTSPVLILAVTGARQTMEQLRADGYMEMPFDPVQLSLAVRKLLGVIPEAV